jgi:hypothetical protein
LVSKEMSNPSRAVCDAMIWSVVCMAHNKAEDDVNGLHPVYCTNAATSMARRVWMPQAQPHPYRRPDTDGQLTGWHRED